MAKKHGMNAVVTLDSDDLSDWVNNTEFPRGAEVHDVTTYGSGGSKEFLSGLKDGGVITISGFHDSAAAGPQKTIEPLVGGAPVVFEWQEGATAGDLTKTVSVIVASYTESTPVGGFISFSADLQMTGAVTLGTVSA